MASPEPTILAFDTSAAHCAAALLMGGKIVASRREEMTKGQAERLFPLLEDVLGEVGAVWGELDAIGVGVGPGNFTGVRISVAAARGLALSLGIPAVGVSTFEAAFELAGAPDGRIAVCLPGPRHLVYWQIFSEGRREAQPFASDRARPAEFATVLPDLVLGPSEDGFAEYRAIDLGGAGMTSAPAFLPLDLWHGLTGAMARRAASGVKHPEQHEPPTPLYIRPADAAPPKDAPPEVRP